MCYARPKLGIDMIKLGITIKSDILVILFILRAKCLNLHKTL